MRYGFVWCPTDDLERCVVPNPVAALGNKEEARRYDELVDELRDWNAQLPTRDSNASLASKGGTASPAGRDPSSGLPSPSSRSRSTAAWQRTGADRHGGVAALVPSALSAGAAERVPLPFVPVWIAAALVALLAPRRERA